jgi:peptide chain release factor 1
MIYLFFKLGESFLTFTSIQKTQSDLSLRMALDDFLVEKLTSIKRTFDALTERLADPDINNDRKLLLSLSRERSSLDKTVASFQEWQKLELERKSLLALEADPSDSDDMKEMIKDELKQLTIKQDKLENELSILLLPQDPNDHRNVMLEVRSGSFLTLASIKP